MGKPWLSHILGLAALVIAACAPSAAPATTTGEPPAQAERQAPQKTLVIAVRGEPPTLALKPLVGFSGALRDLEGPFNASLEARDERGQPFPYLAEALPQVDTESWRVFPDGRMETTYRLKPNLTWHDGTPLSSEDFVFSWRVYATPELGTSRSPPIGSIGDVVALDARSFLIRWKEIYADAGELGSGLPALPRHILQGHLDKLDPAELPNLPYWSSEYLGLGAYRLTRWEPGTFIEGEAFDGHVLGRPKIDRLKAQFIPDPNTALANLLAGEVHYVGKFVLSPDHAAVLEREWGPTQGGAVLYAPTNWRRSNVQLRPEHADPPALLDVRVRRALAHGFDKSLANEVLNAGKGILTDTYTSPLVPYYQELERVITKHPYDLSRAQRLMGEAGFTKGPEGFYLGRDGTPLEIAVYSSSGTKNEQENAVVVDGLRASGFNARPRIIPAAQVGDAEMRAKLPGLAIRGGGGSLRGLQDFTTDQIPRAENRWRGSNYGGWPSAVYDQAYQGFTQTLGFQKRVPYITDMNRLLTEELPVIPYWFQPDITAHVGALKGPVFSQTPDAPSGVLRMHEWEWK